MPIAKVDPSGNILTIIEDFSMGPEIGAFFNGLKSQVGQPLCQETIKSINAQIRRAADIERMKAQAVSPVCQPHLDDGKLLPDSPQWVAIERLREHAERSDGHIIIVKPKSPPTKQRPFAGDGQVLARAISTAPHAYGDFEAPMGWQHNPARGQK